MTTLTVALTCVLIVVARIADVSLGTIRTIMVVQGRRMLAFVLGFVELLIWVAVVSRVIQGIGDQPLYALAYAGGFALGNYIGMTIEARLAMGRQIVRIISRVGPELAQELRTAGFMVTQFDGYGRDGPVQMLFVECPRRHTRQIIGEARRLDPKCYYSVDDVRATSANTVRAIQPTWKTAQKKK